MAEKRTILVCSCEDTMPLDAGAIERGCRGADVVTGALSLPRRDSSASASSRSGRRRDRRSAAPRRRRCSPSWRARAPPSPFANVRETAGWSTDAAKAGPKMAALLAAAAEPLPEVPFVTPLERRRGADLRPRRDARSKRRTCSKDHLDVTVLITTAERPDAAARHRVSGGEGHHQVRQGPSRRVRDRGRRLRRAGAVVARRAELRRAARRRGVALRHRARSVRRRAAVLRRRICATAICAPIRAIRRRCCAPCSRRAISSAPSTSRATSPSPRISARIRARRSSAATAASISARPARSRRPAITSRSTRRSAPAAASAPRPARPAPPPMRCRRPTR